MNRPVRKMVLERFVPGGTGFGANRPVTVLGWCFNISQGKKIIIDAFRVYKDGASISHRVRRSF